MKVSIITATYNRSSTIVRALSSIKTQKYKDIQMVIIDGASLDNTISLVTPMLGENDIFKSEPDFGIYDALNKGLAMADGEVIGFLHSDDLFTDDEVISRVAELFLDDSVDVVYGDICFFANSDEMETKRLYRSGQLSRKNLAWGKMPAHPAIFIRRDIYDKIGYFNTDFKIAADYEFLCRLVSIINPKSVYLPKTLVRMQLGGISTSGFRSTMVLNKEVMRAIRLNGIYTNIFMLLSKYPSKILEFLRT